jgi:hypothetical protein
MLDGTKGLTPEGTCSRFSRPNSPKRQFVAVGIPTVPCSSVSFAESNTAKIASTDVVAIVRSCAVMIVQVTRMTSAPVGSPHADTTNHRLEMTMPYDRTAPRTTKPMPAFLRDLWVEELKEVYLRYKKEIADAQFKPSTAEQTDELFEAVEYGIRLELTPKQALYINEL